MSKIKENIKEKLPKIKKNSAHLTEKEKMDERRERILAKGRKFKYPMQFAKHRLVFVTIAIAFVAMVTAGALGWAALYKFQNTNDVLYRLTTVLPVPVAKIDGERVRYSDYLMIYRCSVTPVEQQNGNLSTEGQDEEGVRAAYKRVALNEAEDYTYALKLAKELDIKVSNEAVDKSFDDHRKVGGADRSKESFLKVLKDNFGLTESEYRRMLYLSLTKVEVAKKIDTVATKKAETAKKKLAENGGDMKAVAEELDIEYEDTNGLRDMMNVDGGRSTVAYNLQPGQISDVFVSLSGDAYYIVKLNEKSDAKVSYASLRIPFTEFDKRLEDIRNSNEIEEYIKLPGTGADAAKLLDEANEM